MYAHIGGKIYNLLNRPPHEFLSISLRNSNHFLSQSEYPFTVRRTALQNYYVFNYGMKTGERYCCEIDSVADLKHLSYLIVMILPFKVANDL
jgi:hypothetical protein